MIGFPEIFFHTFQLDLPHLIGSCFTLSERFFTQSMRKNIDIYIYIPIPMYIHLYGHCAVDIFFFDLKLSFESRLLYKKVVRLIQQNLK